MKVLRPILIDIACGVGLGLIVKGVWEMHPPSAWIVAGVMLAAGATMFARSN